MATRRPRVKPTAILKPRRAQLNASVETNSSIKSELSIKDEEDEKIDIVPNSNAETSDSKSIIDSSENKTPNKAEPNEQKNATTKSDIERKPIIGNKSANSTPSPSFRRLITPPVNIIPRRPNLATAENCPLNHASPVHSSVTVNASPNRKLDEKIIASPKVSGTNDDEVFSPAPENDECFKSPPFMSPSLYSRRVDVGMSPYPTDGFSDDCTKSPSSGHSSKMRQRIRPTPYFGSRRNSIQEYTNEPEDETGRRQRHFSTSSNHSGYTPGTPQPHRSYYGLNKSYSRIRTESLCSNASDAVSTRDYSTKSRRTHRSEELQRVANARREFNLRLNGKPPDKSRLTMYDMIYYNPQTNPMSKPAMKSESKDRGDNMSISSVKTIQSKSSIKSEPTVKAENSESNSEAMPVPQLKLGPNGEIILDEKSLVIERTGDKEAREMLANSDIVYDDEFSGTSGFYKRHKRTRDWPAEETIKFYRSLQAIGTDFSVMLQLFPNRSRRDLKLKFKKEEKHNMALVNKALLHPKEFNIEELKIQFDKEDQEIEAKKAEWVELKKQIASEKKKQLAATKKRAPKKVISSSVRSLTDGDILYENEFVKLPKQKVKSLKRVKQPDAPIQGNNSEHNSVVSSPYPFSLNNNHIESPIKSPVYATQKLPSFTEMLSAQNAKRENNSLGIHNANQENCNENNCRVSVELDQVENPAESVRNDIDLISECEQSTKTDEAIDATLFTAHMPNSKEQLITQSDAGIADSNYQLVSGDEITQYVTKGPSGNYKAEGADDIMNMDIIFDNSPIEEDTSIGNANTHILNSGDNATISVIDSMMHEGNGGMSANIDHVQYEIISEPSLTIDKNNENTIIPSDIIVSYTNEIDPASQVLVFAENNDDDVQFNDCVITSVSDTVNSSTEFGERNESESVLWTNLPQEDKSMAIPSGSDGNANTPIDKPSADFDATKQNSTGSCNAAETVSKKRRRRHEPISVKRRREQLKSSTTTAAPKESDITLVATSTNDEMNDVIEQPIPKIEDNTDADSEVNSSACNFMDSLVVVESHDPNEPNKLIHEVYVMDPITKQMSGQPLDLPDEVIQKIRFSLMPED